MLIPVLCLGLAHASPVALYGPAKGLAFGMSVEQVAKAAPKERYPGVAVSLAPEAFAMAEKASPELFRGRSAATGGNRFNSSTSVRSTWPVIDAAGWSVEVDADGLSRVRARYDTEAAAVAALTDRFGPPTIVARWKIWASPETHIRAVFTGCFQSTMNGEPVGPNDCSVEFSSYRPVSDWIAGELFPLGKKLLGKPRSDYPLGYICGKACTTVQLKPYESSGGQVLPQPARLHVQRKEPRGDPRRAHAHVGTARRAGGLLEVAQRHRGLRGQNGVHH